MTHDRVEALALGDAVVVLDGGRVRQSGPVHEVFSRPADDAVARIVGIDTVEPARVLEIVDGLASLAVGPVRLLALAEGSWVGEGYVCIRAEDVILAKAGDVPSSARNRLAVNVRSMVREGPMVRVGLEGGFPLTALVSAPSVRGTRPARRRRRRRPDQSPGDSLHPAELLRDCATNATRSLNGADRVPCVAFRPLI